MKENNPVLDEDLRPVSLGIDGQGLLYQHHGKLLRGIRSGHESFYRSLLDRPIIRSLIHEGKLVNTTISSVHLAAHRLVLEHSILPVVSYPFEWTPSMMLAAAKLIFEINSRLMEDNLCLHDGHLWNVVFNRARPVFVDFTSIVAYESCRIWEGFTEFINGSIAPLLLAADGNISIARALLRDQFAPMERGLATHCARRPNYGKGVLIREGDNIILAPCRLLLNRFFDLCFRVHYRLDPYGAYRFKLKQIEKLLHSIDVRPAAGGWSNYFQRRNNEAPLYDGTLDKLTRAIESETKPRTVAELIERVKPERLIDLGCNRGIYSQFAALHGAIAIGIDTDEAALDQMYLDSEQLGSSAFPIFANVVAPVEPVNALHRPLPTFCDRFRGDFVLCLALVHHISLSRSSVTMADIATILRGYTTQAVLVEFVSREDRHVRALYPDCSESYTLTNFKQALSNHFESIEEFPSFPQTRHLLLCRI